jgi:hypothetical protein
MKDLVPAVAIGKGNPLAALDVLEPYIAAHPGDATSLFLAMRVLFQAKMDGRSVRGTAEDAALIKRYGALYEAAGGSEKEIVVRWVAFVAGTK